MIRSVEIKGLRGIREGKLADLTPLVVLVGPNGSGKSTVLEGLLIGTSPRPTDAVEQVIRRHEAGGSGPLWLFWRQGNTATTEIKAVSDQSAARICQLSFDRSRPESNVLINVEIIDNGSLRGQGAVSVVHNTLQPGHRPTAFLPLDSLQDVRLVEGFPTALQSPLYDLYSSAARHGRQGVVRQIINEVLPTVSNIEILTESGRPIVYLDFDHYSVPATLAGDGVLSLLRLTLDLAVGDGVVLLEEPEVHMHPGAIRQCARAILAAVRRGIQVILTTHSLELIDSLDGESSDADLEQQSLYRLVLEDGLLKSSRLPGPDVAFSRNQIQDDLR